MQKIVSLLIFLGLIISSYAQTKKVLFIGNSYTGVNNLPNLISSVANSAGKTLIYDSHTPGGTQLATHATSTTVEAKIALQNWNFVVIQGQSQEMSWALEGEASSRFTSCSILSDKIRANYECSVPMFYMTWGRKNGDANNCGWRTCEGMDSLTI